MKILIVDDELAFREISKEILKPLGQCIMAEDGIEAVNLFENALATGTPFKLVLLDIQMPHMDGQETLKKMRRLENRSKIPVHEEATIIMATSLDSPRNTREAFQFGGCTDYIVKPVTKPILIEILKECKLIKD